MISTFLVQILVSQPCHSASSIKLTIIESWNLDNVGILEKGLYRCSFLVTKHEICGFLYMVSFQQAGVTSIKHSNLHANPIVNAKCYWIEYAVPIATLSHKGIWPVAQWSYVHSSPDSHTGTGSLQLGDEGVFANYCAFKTYLPFQSTNHIL